MAPTKLSAVPDFVLIELIWKRSQFWAMSISRARFYSAENITVFELMMTALKNVNKLAVTHVVNREMT